MAGIPLNTFRTVTFKPTTDEKVVYVANTGLTSIVLMAQAAVATGATSGTITFKHWRSAGGANPSPGDFPNSNDTFTTILLDAVIPPHDALVLLGGKLVLETFDYVTLSANQSDKIEFISSILETANQ
ncbi:hypothetical protein UFOVP29_88 [uncultured Caudovirales phage]|uniref:Uncharacterized protein n=1 Tax=uncultured Caudovirales phage TaxID=2100421 RepID=A0A6J5KNZ9_9CAUD|nr:hypothetical protein UFOVP29_88 [uncultured Caudovirales phage]